jgi:hypothetical protein
MVSQEAGKVSLEHPQSSWVIDIDWFEKNNRSFIDLVRRSLCPKCADKLQKKKKKLAAGDILAAIKDCCARSPGFITPKLPILESAFRVLLAGDNKPMEVGELSKELSLRRGADAYTPRSEALDRLLSNDRWYGFKQVA